MIMRISSLVLIAASVAVMSLSVVGNARGAIVSLSGDYGLHTWASTNPTPVPIGTTNLALNFGSAPAAPKFGLTLPFIGSIDGDIVVDNIGGFTLGMKITNVNFNAITPVSAGLTTLQIDVIEDFAIVAPGNYAAQQILNGNWPANPLSIVSMGSSVINLDGTATNLAPLGGNNAGSTTNFNLNGPLTSGNSPFLVVSLQSSLTLQISNAGLITLSSSADLVVRFVPAPGAMSLAGLAGLAALRRQRRLS